jgi:hypothetical protein
MIDYKYSEDKILQELKEYVDSTYGQHYSQNKFQASEFIIDAGHGEGFTIGNILKYAQRYGRKGSSDEWRKDLLKVVHYAIMALHIHDQKHKNATFDAFNFTNPVAEKDPLGYYTLGNEVVFSKEKENSPDEADVIAAAAKQLSKMADAEKVKKKPKGSLMTINEKIKAKIDEKQNTLAADQYRVEPRPAWASDYCLPWASDDLFVQSNREEQ